MQLTHGCNDHALNHLNYVSARAWHLNRSGSAQSGYGKSELDAVAGAAQLLPQRPDEPLQAGVELRRIDVGALEVCHHARPQRLRSPQIGAGSSR